MTEQDCYGDGNVYRGIRSKDPEVKTVEVNDFMAPRPAVRLSDAEIDDIAIQHDFIPRFIRAIETAVLKKNGLEVGSD